MNKGDLFYIASSLGRAEEVAALCAVLEKRGLRPTYKWWLHGSVHKLGAERIAEVAAAEISGVINADTVIVLLPGGRGTHVELGVAIGTYVAAHESPASGPYPTEIIVVGDTFMGKSTECAFYYHPLVRRIASVELLLAEVPHVDGCDCATCTVAA